MNWINLLFFVSVCAFTYIIDVDIDYLEERFCLTLTQDEKKYLCLLPVYSSDIDPKF